MKRNITFIITVLSIFLLCSENQNIIRNTDTDNKKVLIIKFLFPDQINNDNDHIGKVFDIENWKMILANEQFVINQVNEWNVEYKKLGILVDTEKVYGELFSFLKKNEKYMIYYFESSKKTWQGRYGREGYIAFNKDDEIQEVYIIRIS